MIVFSCTKLEFMQYVSKGEISTKVYDAYKRIFNKKTKFNQIKAWANSLPLMADIIENLPDDTGISIEYGIPLTSKSIDMVISGYDFNKEPIIILVELKQWSYSKLIKSVDGVVRTKINQHEKNVLHPAYQVLTYAQLLKNYNIGIDENKIQVVPIVYLHNYNLNINDTLYNIKYKTYDSKVYMFGRDDKDSFKELVESLIFYGDNLEVINNIDMSDTRPTKKFLDVLNNMVKGQKEFRLVDEQKIVMEEIINLAEKAFRENKKIVMIIKGGPGTGKSVLAINALGEMLSLGLMGAYVSKNMAPRKVYKNKLVSGDNEISVHELFKSSGYFFLDEDNKYDFLLVDEAHRLQEKSGIHNNIGENQIKEIIKSAKFSAFFIDEAQAITLKDIGTIANIKYFAKELDAEIFEEELISQFRCNGSDSYLDFVEHFLYNKRGNIKFNFDFRVMDSPNELRKLIEVKNTNNNARIVAGFCWPRQVKTADNQNYHDIKIGEFEMSWNLKHGEPFATRENAINEVGCIYNVQGLEFDYIGVIIGPDLKYEKEKVITDYKARANTEKSLYGINVLIKKDKDYYEKLADTIIRNTYRVLFTRGTKGCYVYACDKKLQRHLKKLQDKCSLLNIKE